MSRRDRSPFRMSLRCARLFLLCALVMGVALTHNVMAAETPTSPDFGSEIRPLLSNACFACHGPDEAHREADLRLDTFEGATRDLGGYVAIVPGDLSASAVIERITSTDPDIKMPPPDSGQKLTPEQIDLIKEWVEAGAKYERHWAFETPVRPEVPTVHDSTWVRNPIDAFVLSKLETEGLAPAPEAAPVTLVRRLSLDLIGLPPTIGEVDRFLARAEGTPEAGDAAYVEEIERLLQSPHYGERWGRLWLDAARYADSDGFEKDKPREVWFYRDWVIRAFNDDLPYDRFIIEQLAGDLLPDATQDQHVATGFLRNSMINEEGGVDPEQFRMEAMFDRMDAIGKSILGLTTQCAQCHNHKYDPLSQVDYYRMFAFFNQCHESQITVYTPEQQTVRDVIFAQVEVIERELKESRPDWRDAMRAWEETVQNGEDTWTIVRPELDASGGQKHYLLEDGSILAAGYAPTKHTTTFDVEVPNSRITAIRLELLNDPNLPHGGPGRSIYGTCALTEFEVVATPLEEGAKPITPKFAKAEASVNPDEAPLGEVFDDRSNKQRVTGPIEYAIDSDPLTAWTVENGPGRSNTAQEAIFTFKEPLESEKGFRITFKLSQRHGGWNSDDNQNNNLGRFRFAVSGERTSQPLPGAVHAALAIPREERTEADWSTLFGVWRKTVPDWQAANARIEELWQQHPRGTSQLVLAERKEWRPTHRLDRGDFLKPAEPVTPGVPGFLHPLEATEAGRALDRLDFAQWIVDERAPTTARAIVNRIWQAYFGIGLVETAEDLGTQGASPSHPKLLDWLAVELMENGWSLKHIHRLILNSATYRQSSGVDPDLYGRDPYNRLLARGARFRVDGEIVRDIALATSGLLNREVGGPSVYPPAPKFLFEPPASYGPKVWNTETDGDRYRRALYTFRYRSVPYPALQSFDVPNGDASCVRRTRSNTPLQALTTLNEPLFLECARALASDVLEHSNADDPSRLAFAFRRCVARAPQPRELEVLTDVLETSRERFSMAEDEARRFLKLGEESDRLPAGATVAEWAAWATVARVVLNLDETITRE